MIASEHPAALRYARHVNPTLVRLLGALGYGRVYVRASGTRLFDHEGRAYLDCVAGYGAANLGHNPPELLERLRDALAEELPSVMHVGPQIAASELAEALAVRAAPLSVCMFSCTGGEAIEAALKLARAATRRTAVLYTRGGFHGTGLGSLSVTGHGRLRDPFEPLVPDCFEIPYGDLEALEKALGEHKVACLVLEPIQAEAGVILPPPGYLKTAQQLCTKHGALLVLDEVQTGLGRTGKTFAYEHEGSFVPDVLVLGKALGGSLLPLSATLTTSDVHERAYGAIERYALHGTTFSGYALGCRVALAALHLLEEKALVEAAATRGAELRSSLEERLDGHPLVRGVRGRGLLVGLELGPTEKGGWLSRLLPGVVESVARRVFGQWLALRLLERGVVCQPASQQWNVLKITPPLTVSSEEIAEVTGAIVEILAEYRDLKPLIVDVGARLGKQLRAGWTF